MNLAVKALYAADFVDPDVKASVVAYRLANPPKAPGVYSVRVQGVCFEGDRLVVDVRVLSSNARSG